MVALFIVRYWMLQKAFDRVDYCKLFRTLIDKKLPTVCIRLLANMYTNHVTRVAWNGVPSGRFSVKNGVKQERC